MSKMSKICKLYKMYEMQNNKKNKPIWKKTSQHEMLTSKKFINAYKKYKIPKRKQIKKIH